MSKKFLVTEKKIHHAPVHFNALHAWMHCRQLLIQTSYYHACISSYYYASKQEFYILITKTFLAQGIIIKVHSLSPTAEEKNNSAL